MIHAERVSAFSIVNYRRFFVGQSLSNIGTWFQLLAQSLLVLRLTGRADALAETVAFQALPVMLLGPLVAPLLDRVDLRRLIIWVNLTAAAEAAGLSALTATHHVTINWIFGFAVALGFVQIFNQPSIQAFVSVLVPREAIPSAVSLSGVVQGIGRLAGPALAALVYAWRGPSTCFAVNAASYVVVTAALLSLRKHELHGREPGLRTRGALLDTLRYAWNSPQHRGQLVANAFVGVFAFNFMIFYASFTQLVLHSGSVTLGIAESVNAASAVAGGIVLSRRLRHPTRRTYVSSCLGLGVSLSVTSIAPNIAIFYMSMVIFGVALVYYISVNQAVLQLNTPRDRIGSIMTLSSYGSTGTTPIGAAIVGWLTAVGSVRLAIAVGAAAMFVAAAALSRSLFRDQETLPEAATSMGDAHPS